MYYLIYDKGDDIENVGTCHETLHEAQEACKAMIAETGYYVYVAEYDSDVDAYNPVWIPYND